MKSVLCQEHSSRGVLAETPGVVHFFIFVSIEVCVPGS